MSFASGVTVADMIGTGRGFCDPSLLPLAMAELSIDLRGLKCPLPALRTRKALAGLQRDDVLVVACTDPLAGIDIPNLVRQTGDALEETRQDAKALTFRIRKR
jgi:tRNA 2-thiouridine synthesizing protein A